MTVKDAQIPINLRNGRKLFHMAEKYKIFFYFKDLQNIPKLSWKYQIWQPWSMTISKARNEQGPIHLSTAIVLSYREVAFT
jgi:hypothetical protein